MTQRPYTDEEWLALCNSLRLAVYVEVVGLLLDRGMVSAAEVVIEHRTLVAGDEVD